MNCRFVANIVDTSRSAKSCRLRWENQLKPNIDHTPFRAEEDQLILRVGNPCKLSFQDLCCLAFRACILLLPSELPPW